MWKADWRVKKRGSKHSGYLCCLCCLLVFFSAFLFVWNVTAKLRDHHNERLTEFEGLVDLSVYDIRADMYARLETGTDTFHDCTGAVTINSKYIYLNEKGELLIQKGE